MTKSCPFFSADCRLGLARRSRWHPPYCCVGACRHGLPGPPDPVGTLQAAYLPPEPVRWGEARRGEASSHHLDVVLRVLHESEQERPGLLLWVWRAYRRGAVTSSGLPALHRPVGPRPARTGEPAADGPQSRGADGRPTASAAAITPRVRRG